MRCEIEIEPFSTVVVMFTLRETVFGRIRPFCSAGLLTRGVLAFGAFPVLPSGKCQKPHRLQLRGQSRFWPLMGSPHRIPI